MVPKGGVLRRVSFLVEFKSGFGRSNGRVPIRLQDIERRSLEPVRYPILHGDVSRREEGLDVAEEVVESGVAPLEPLKVVLQCSLKIALSNQKHQLFQYRGSFHVGDPIKDRSSNISV